MFKKISEPLTPIIYKYLFVILTCSAILRATPPDVITSEIILLGGSPEKAVFLVKTGYNLGSHYLWESRWYYMCMDLSDFTFEFNFQGSLVSASEEYGGVRYSTDFESQSIPGILQFWDVNDIQFYTVSYSFPWDTEELNCSIQDNCLYLTGGEDEIVFPEVRCFDPGYLAVWNTDFEEFFMGEDDSPVRELDFSSEELVLEIDRGVQLGEVYLLIGRIYCEEAFRDVVLYIPGSINK